MVDLALVVLAVVVVCHVCAETAVIFAPFNANAVGIFDEVTNAFSATITTGSLTGDWKFAGAATFGTKVIFAPCYANVVGVFDVLTSTFSTVTTGSLTVIDKFIGAATVGTMVIFCPV